jgi:hypothetical protein
LNDLADRITGLLYRCGLGETEPSERQIIALSGVLNKCRPDLEDVWIIILRILPSISRIPGFTREEAEITREALLWYVVGRVG